ncbi:hypothetical protein BC831DRAFT_553511 [Entophlyctis helioformis]|nr:hypothetical protein BC831DRAFT_553511 [Entophlyctis helioformis]
MTCRQHTMVFRGVSKCRPMAPSTQRVIRRPSAVACSTQRQTSCPCGSTAASRLPAQKPRCPTRWSTLPTSSWISTARAFGTIQGSRTVWELAATSKLCRPTKRHDKSASTCWICGSTCSLARTA